MRLTPLFVLSLVVVPASLASAQTFDLTDSLRGTTTGTVSGGTLGAEGWTVTGVADRITWALPRLVSGYVEFTVDHVATGVNLPLADQEIFAMYEAGYGIAEPIRYAPEFRNNHYKMLVRIYGDVEAGRVGAMKLMWGMCPSGAPGYDSCGCASFFAEPFDQPGPWDGTAHRIRVEWGDGVSRLLRDGEEVVRVDWGASGLSFGPSELHMMLGSPRNDGGLSQMPLGATFSDLVVHGEMGALSSCPGASTDAGVPGDAGTCSTAGAALADATVASWETGVFPDPSDLNVEGTAAGPDAIVYLRFPAVAGPVSSATLRLETADFSSAAGGSGEVCVVTGGSWDEATLTWATRPTVGTACTGSAHSVGPSQVVTWDVTSLVAPGGDVVLAIVSTDTDGAHYLSREAGGCARGPRLEVTLGTPSDGGTTTLDAGGIAMDAGDPLDAGVAPLDAGRGGVRERSTSCGCGVGRPRALSGLAVSLLVLALGLRRTRQKWTPSASTRTTA